MARAGLAVVLAWASILAIRTPAPFPADASSFVEPLPEVIVRVPPIYPEKARRAGIEGIVLVQARVGELGSVTDTKVVRSVAALDSAAVVAMRQWQFEPARVNDQPISTWVAVPMRFGPFGAKGLDCHANGSDDSTVANAPSRLVAPSTFPALPAPIRLALSRENRRIPAAEPCCNVFSAELERPGQRDWVVYSTTSEFANLVVFWGGSPQRTSEVLRGPALEDTSDVDCSCYFVAATPQRIRTHIAFWEKHLPGAASSFPKILPLTHDSIEASFGRSSSTIHYWREGHWVAYPFP